MQMLRHKCGWHPPPPTPLQIHTTCDDWWLECGRWGREGGAGAFACLNMDSAGRTSSSVAAECPETITSSWSLFLQHQKKNIVISLKPYNTLNSPSSSTVTDLILGTLIKRVLRKYSKVQSSALNALCTYYLWRWDSLHCLTLFIY